MSRSRASRQRTSRGIPGLLQGTAPRPSAHRRCARRPLHAFLRVPLATRQGFVYRARFVGQTVTGACKAGQTARPQASGDDRTSPPALPVKQSSPVACHAVLVHAHPDYMASQLLLLRGWWPRLRQQKLVCRQLNQGGLPAPARSKGAASLAGPPLRQHRLQGLPRCTQLLGCLLQCAC